jgi:hypothetical protein
MGHVNADKTLKLKDGSPFVVWVLAAFLIVGCGESRGQVTTSSSLTTPSVVASPPSSLPPSTSLAATTTSKPAVPNDGELVGDFEDGGVAVADSPEVNVEPGETVLVPLEFEGAARASIILVLDSIEGVTARFGDSLLERSALFATETLSAELLDPIDGDLQVVNDGPGSVTGGVLMFLDSPRRLSVSAEPSQIPLGGTVEITVMLTDSSPDDQVQLAATSQGGTEITFPAMELDSAGIATTTFTPDRAGFYTVAALVEGERPRIDSALIEVQLDQPGSDTGGGDP